MKTRRTQDTIIATSLPAAVVIASLWTASSANADLAKAAGYNDFGQIGDGTKTHRNVRVAVTNMDRGVTAIAAAGMDSYSIKDGSVYAWGDNQTFGGLGNGTYVDSKTPVLVIGLNTGVTALASGGFHGMVIQDGGLKTWGYNNFGQLGDGSTVINRNAPISVSGMTSGVTAIAGGGFHSLAIQNGALKAWGGNSHGELGNGVRADKNYLPVDVIGLESGVTAIAAGYSHSLAIQNGAAKAWGAGNYFQLGNNNQAGIPSPINVPGLSSGVTAVAAGFDHSLAIKDGNVYAWGFSQYGQCGNGTTEPNKTPQLALDAPVNIVAIAAGYSASYALAADGSLWLWGYCQYGELGLGESNVYFKSPEHLLAPAGYRYASISAQSQGQSSLATLRLNGDLDGDDNVNFDDLVKLAQHYNQAASATLEDGDLTGDGAVNFDDLVPLAQNYNASLGANPLVEFSSAFIADWTLARAVVPEPTSLSLVVLAGTIHSRRRRVR